MLLLTLVSCNTQTTLWRSLSNGVKQVASAAGSAYLYESCVSYGYTEEESRKMIHDAYELFGGNIDNANLGISYIEADNKFERENVIKDVVFNVAAEASGNPSLVRKFQIMTDAQLTYLSDKQKASSDEELQDAFDKRTLAYANLFYDAYQEGKTKRAKYLAKKLQIRNQLMEQGYTDSNLAIEVAGNIIAVQNSDIPEHEKKAILKGYGFKENVNEIQQTTAEVINMDDSLLNEQDLITSVDNTDNSSINTNNESETAEKAKALEERKRAIQNISNSEIPVFAFDDTDITEPQKAALNEIAIVMDKYPDLTISIVGHTCKIGYKNINLKKGLKRAENAKAYLIEQGISENRISVDSKGETEPRSDINSENRRIEITVNN